MKPEEFIRRFRARYKPCGMCTREFLPSRTSQKYCSGCQCNPAKYYKLKKAGLL